MCGIAENRIPEWRAPLAVCRNNRKKGFLAQVLGLFGVLLRNGMLNLPKYFWIEMKLRHYKI